METAKATGHSGLTGPQISATAVNFRSKTGSESSMVLKPEHLTKKIRRCIRNREKMTQKTMVVVGTSYLPRPAFRAGIIEFSQDLLEFSARDMTLGENYREFADDDRTFWEYDFECVEDAYEC